MIDLAGQFCCHLVVFGDVGWWAQLILATLNTKLVLLTFNDLERGVLVSDQTPFDRGLLSVITLTRYIFPTISAPELNLIEAFRGIGM